MHSDQAGRLLPARPDAVSVKTRSGVMPARRDGVVLLIDGLLPGGHREVRGGGHTAMEPAGSDNSSGVRFTGTRTRL